LQLLQQVICKLSFVGKTQAKIKVKEYPVFVYKSGKIRLSGKDNNKSDLIYQQMTNLENASHHSAQNIFVHFYLKSRLKKCTSARVLNCVTHAMKMRVSGCGFARA
jgi:hypothetical protein